MKILRLPLLLLFAFLPFCAARAADPTPAEQAKIEELRKIIMELKPQTGEIVLDGGVAKVTVPPHMRYFDSKDTRTILTKLWNNPDHGPNLGMLVPEDFNPFAEESWAVKIMFDDTGYVKDDDASTIDYTKLLAQMKESIAEASKERVKEGYPSIELVGWATPPHYDSKGKKLYWAKELKFSNETDNTLNYDFRLLGRRGVLILSAIANMKQLPVIEAHAQEILGAVNFMQGHRYADFTESTDKVATYGLAALIAGGIAAKAGFLKGLWLAIIALKKFIIIGIVALFGVFKKGWNWIRGRRAADAAPAVAVATTPSAPARTIPPDDTVIVPGPPDDPTPPAA